MESLRGPAAHLPGMATQSSGRSALLIDLENLLFDAEREHTEPLPIAVGQPAAPSGRRYLRATDALYYPWVDDDHATHLIATARRDAAQALAGAPDYSVAAAIPYLMRRVTFLPVMDGIAPRIVSHEPDAADTYLLDIAEHLASVGFTRFVIVSGDHAFAEFASRYETTVVARGRRALSNELRMAAARVHLLADEQPA